MNAQPLVKICGITSPNLAEVAVEAGADMIGLVFIKRSPRYVTIEQAKQIADAIAGRAEIVGLFEKISSDFTPPNFINTLQLYGPMPLSRIARLAPISVIKPIPFNPAMIEDQLQLWNEQYHQLSNLKALVIDTPDPTKVGGGTGQTFNWHDLKTVLDHIKPDIPIMLAGGLTPQNVKQAIDIIHPDIVDVSSGVESKRGIKDPDLIRQFIHAIK